MWIETNFNGYGGMKIRSKKHLSYIREQPCCVADGKGQNCNGTIIQAHHLTFCGGHGMATKECDSLTVPLCHSHHINLHHIGEKRWWQNWGIDALGIARDLSNRSPDKRIREITKELL